MPKSNTIQIFEYSWLIVNEKYGPGKDILFSEEHFRLLAQYLTNNPGNSYYTVYLNRIRFCNYVGVIKVKHLTIEVLPKTDRHNTDKAVWQKVLIQMLSISLDVKAQTTTNADIVLHNHSVLETYLYLFLKETEILLHYGLIKKYRVNISNQPSLKGKLLVHQHVTKNVIHAERFYVAHQIYDRDNIYNTILQEALLCISSLSVSDSITKLCNKIMLNFPECSTVIKISENLFERLLYDRKTARYRKAIELARILLLNYHPDVKGGKNNILAIMFDMNLLWESYIFRMLAKASYEEKLKCFVFPQRYAAFWKHPDSWTLHLVPDIVIQLANGDTIILDTKWKFRNDTSPDDIRQLYAYGNYFNAKKRYLIYPEKLNASKSVYLRTGKFYTPGENEVSSNEICGLAFVDLLNPNNSLNINIGHSILKELFKA